jgi:hypothetical protein
VTYGVCDHGALDKAAFERVAYDARLRSTRARTAVTTANANAYQKPALPLASTHSRDFCSASAVSVNSSRLPAISINAVLTSAGVA